MAKTRRQSIVADGQMRIRDSERERVQQKVAARYHKKLAAAGWLRRLWIRSKMNREIRRELDNLARTEGCTRPSLRGAQENSRIVHLL